MDIKKSLFSEKGTEDKKANVEFPIESEVDMPKSIAIAGSWTAASVRNERISQLHYNYGTPAYKGSCCKSLQAKAEKSLVTDGFVRNGSLTLNGKKLATKLEKLGVIKER